MCARRRPNGYADRTREQAAEQRQGSRWASGRPPIASLTRLRLVNVPNGSRPRSDYVQVTAGLSRAPVGLVQRARVWQASEFDFGERRGPRASGRRVPCWQPPWVGAHLGCAGAASASFIPLSRPVGLEPWFTMGVSLLRALHGAPEPRSGGLLLGEAHGHSQPSMAAFGLLRAPMSAIQHATRLSGCGPP